MNQKHKPLETAGGPKHLADWAITVNELEAGEFHFSLLKAVDRSDELLGYRPELTGDTAHARPMDAWIAGILALRRHGASKARSEPPAAAADAFGHTLAAG